MFKCKYCGVNFTPTYRIGVKKIHYCSKSCAQKQNKTQTKAHYITSILDKIKEKNEYLSIERVSKLCNISNKTLVKHNISIVSLNSLLGFNKPKSIFEENTFLILKSVFSFVDIEREKKFNDLLSPKNYPLSFDFYIKSLNLIIEADGTQHYDKKNPNYTKYNFNNDQLKNKYCFNNNIDIVRIKYSRKITYKHIKRAFNTPSLRKLFEYSENLKDETISSQASLK